MFDPKISGNVNYSVFNRVFFILSVVVLMYFMVATFGFIGDVKDRTNYEMTFLNMNEFESNWSLFFGSSILYGLLWIFGVSSSILSACSVIFLIAKIILIKRFLNSWVYVFIYLIKFAFTIDLILLKESLALFFVLFAIFSARVLTRSFFSVLAIFTHISALSIFLLVIKSRMEICFLIVLIFCGLIYFYYSADFLDFVFINYIFSKTNSYFSESKNSFLISNPIFWMGIILAAYALYRDKYNSRILIIQLFSIAMGFFHPLLGIIGFRFWQFSSFVDLLSLSLLGSRLFTLLYILPNLLFFLYGAVYLRNFVDS